MNRLIEWKLNFKGLSLEFPKVKMSESLMRELWSINMTTLNLENGGDIFVKKKKYISNRYYIFWKCSMLYHHSCTKKRLIVTLARSYHNIIEIWFLLLPFLWTTHITWINSVVKAFEKLEWIKYHRNACPEN